VYYTDHNTRRVSQWLGMVVHRLRIEMKKLVTLFLQNESGVTAIEYGLIAALISVVCIGAMTTAGTQLNAVYTNISGHLTTALAGGGGAAG
jgi:pilus assembly protein Flp/PilA